MIKKLLTLVTLILVSCDNDGNIGCDTVVCASPFVGLNLIDSSSQNNIILRDDLKVEDFKITDNEENLIQFSINTNNGLLFIEKMKEKDTYEIVINSVETVILSFETSTPDPDACCDFGNLINVDVVGKAFTTNEKSVTIEL